MVAIKAELKDAEKPPPLPHADHLCLCQHQWLVSVAYNHLEHHRRTADARDAHRQHTQRADLYDSLQVAQVDVEVGVCGEVHVDNVVLVGDLDGPVVELVPALERSVRGVQRVADDGPVLRVHIGQVWLRKRDGVRGLPASTAQASGKNTKKNLNYHHNCCGCVRSRARKDAALDGMHVGGPGHVEHRKRVPAPKICQTGQPPSTPVPRRPSPRRAA
eukprot:530118-Rhodomonas_salina.4